MWLSPMPTRAAALAAALFFAGAAHAQTVSCTGPTGANCVPVVPYTASGAIGSSNPLSVTTAAPAAGTAGAGYPPGATPITGNATGSTAAVVGTLAAASTKFTYICGFSVSALGGTAAVGPITIAGTVGSSLVYQLASAASGSQLTQTFTPCIPASAVNTAITTTTTADGTATAVDVNSWGFQQ